MTMTIESNFKTRRACRKESRDRKRRLFNTPVADVQGIFDELERDGLICRTGEMRNGQPVYVATALGKRRHRDV
jgi:hypothetical protein